MKLRTDDAHDARLAQLCADHDRVQLVLQGTQSFRVMGLWDSSGQMVVSEKASRRNELVNRLTGNLVFWGMALLGAGAIVVGIKKQREE